MAYPHSVVSIVPADDSEPGQVKRSQPYLADLLALQLHSSAQLCHLHADGGHFLSSPLMAA